MLNQNKAEGTTAYPAPGFRRVLYMVFGMLSLALAALGTVLPFLPTTPFVLLAAICFGRSSRRLHMWFLSTRFYRKNLESFVQRRGMTLKTKLTLLAVITLFMGFSFLTMLLLSAPIFARIALAVVWLCHVLYFGFKVQTIS